MPPACLFSERGITVRIEPDEEVLDRLSVHRPSNCACNAIEHGSDRSRPNDLRGRGTLTLSTCSHNEHSIA